MTHAQKPDFVFRRNGRVHLNRRSCQFSRLLAAEVCTSALIVSSNAGYNMFRGSVKSTGYPPHLPVSHSLPLPCVTVCDHIATRLYKCLFRTSVFSSASFVLPHFLYVFPIRRVLVFCVGVSYRPICLDDRLCSLYIKSNRLCITTRNT